MDKLNLLQFAVKVNTTKLDIKFLPDGGGVMYPRIRDLREDRDLKQREVAEYLYCSQQVYSNYELGQRDVPSETLIRLSRFYNVSVDYILSLTDDPKTNRRRLTHGRITALFTQLQIKFIQIKKSVAIYETI